MLIAVCGIDGAGKSSVVHQLKRSLIAANYRCQILDRWDILSREHFPECGFLSCDLAELKDAVANMPTVASGLFLFWTLAMSLKECRAGGSNQLFLSDGYWMKHAAAEVVYGTDRLWVERTTELFPRPELVFFLRVSPEIALKRKPYRNIYECGRDDSCSEAAFISHQTAVQNVLGEWSAQFNWIEVDGAESVDEQCQVLLRHVLNRVQMVIHTAALHPAQP